MKATFNYFVALCAFCGLAFAAPLTTEGRLAELEDRVDDVEFQAGLDKIKFGLDFSVGVSESWFETGDYTRWNPTGYTATGAPDAQGAATTTGGQYPWPQQGDKWKAHNKWSMFLNLNMTAPISDYVKFYGRLSMAKNFGMMDRNLNSTDALNNPLDIDAGRDLRTSGAVLYVSRAYVDLFLSPEFVATLGRQPATEGPGANLRNNAARQATYPALLFNVLGDGAVLSYKPSFAKRANLAVRAAYAKVYQFDRTSSVMRQWSGTNGDTDAGLLFGSVELAPHLGGFAKDALIMLSYARLQALALDLSSINSSWGTQNIGYSDLANLHLEFHNMFRLPFHLFASVAYYNGVDAMGVGKTPLSALGLAAAGSEEGSDTFFNLKSGYAIHAGLRYDFHRLFKLGFEYFYGSRYFYALTRPSFNDPMDFRTTRGNVYDVYVISQLDRNQFLRLSYTLTQNKYTNAGYPMGGAQRMDATANSVMLIYNVKF